MDRTDHSWVRSCTVPYIIVGLGWAVLAWWIVPPLLVADRPGPMIAVVKQVIRVPGVAWLEQDLIARWREFSWAVLFAIVIHLTIVVILGRYDRRAHGGESSAGTQAASRSSLALATVAAVFLAVTILAGARQDYFFYLQIWYHVRRGEDPWFDVFGMDGKAPLNAYGPLFNLLAPLAWVNPMAPKLLFAYAYIVFAIARIKGFAAGHVSTRLRAIGLAALFWNPFAWVELAFYGHFDVLVGLACLGAVRACERGRDIRAGACLAAGVLLKYLPIVLLPFLAFDRGRPRVRLLCVTLATIAVGLGLSFQVWGLSTFSPLGLAASRGSRTLSIFYFLRARFSPLPWIGVWPNVDHLEPLVQILALSLVWWWSWNRRPGVEASAVVAVATAVLLYRVGYPQYPMVTLVMASAWALGQWDRLRNRTALAVAMAGYFGWLAAFDVYYMLYEAWHINLRWFLVHDFVGLPTFLLGGAFVAAMVRAATPSGETRDPL